MAWVVEDRGKEGGKEGEDQKCYQQVEVLAYLEGHVKEALAWTLGIA